MSDTQETSPGETAAGPPYDEEEIVFSPDLSGRSSMRNFPTDERHLNSILSLRSSMRNPASMAQAGEKKDPKLRTVTKDCYTLIATGSCQGFLYGLMVFFFQITGLVLIFLSKRSQDIGENEDIDNPDKNLDREFVNYIPANESILVITTQIFAALAFIVFVDNSSKDVIQSFHVLSNCLRNLSEETPFRNLSDETPRRYNKYLFFFSFFLRLVQGIGACLTALLLVMTSSDVIDIVLNFTAINYISELDESAFEILQNGWMGESLKREADKIDEDLQFEFKSVNDSTGTITMTLNHGIHSWDFTVAMEKSEQEEATESKVGASDEDNDEDETPFRRAYNWGIRLISVIFIGDIGKGDDRSKSRVNDGIPSRRAYCLGTGLISTIFIVLMAIILSYQQSPDEWTTKLLRVEFDESDLQQYSGCYMASDETHDRRIIYKPWDSSSPANFQYCRKEKRWVFLRENVTDPCNYTDAEIAHSYDTFSFDISTAFEIPWVSPILHRRVDMFFIPNQENSEDPINGLFCNQTIGDGTCNKDLNKRDFKYDGGDCCPTTCIKAVDSDDPDGSCGIVRFGKSFSFPNCTDHNMINLELQIDRFEHIDFGDSSSSRFEWLDYRGANYWGKIVDDSGSELELQCNGRDVFSKVFSTEINEMSKEDYSVRLGKGVDCSLILNTFELLYDVDYNISNKELLDENGINVTTTTQNSIPSTIGMWGSLSALDLSDMSLVGSIPEEIESIGKKSTRRINLSNNKLTGKMPRSISTFENLVVLDLSNNDLTGTIPTEIGLLTQLSYLDLSGNSFEGTIPAEIESLQKLRYLDLSGNSLEGIIPTGIGSLIQLDYLNLIFGGNLELRGSFDCSRLTMLNDDVCTQNQRSVSYSSVVNLICSQGELDDMCNIIISTKGMTENLSNGEWTVFAFLDGSIQRLRNERMVSKDAEEKILAYHLSEEKLYMNDLVCAELVSMYKGYNGKTTRTKCEFGSTGKKFQKGGGNSELLGIPFVTFDLEAANGVVHIINGTLLDTKIDEIAPLK